MNSKQKRLEIKEKKRAKAIEDNKRQLDNKQQGNNELLLSKEKEVFKNNYNKRLDEIDELSKNWLWWLEIRC